MAHAAVCRWGSLMLLYVCSLLVEILGYLRPFSSVFCLRIVHLMMQRPLCVYGQVVKLSEYRDQVERIHSILVSGSKLCSKRKPINSCCRWQLLHVNHESRHGCWYHIFSSNFTRPHPWLQAFIYQSGSWNNACGF